MAQSSDAFSNSVNNIRDLLHVSIGDIDALLRGETAGQTSVPSVTEEECIKHTATAADLAEALRRIERLEGSVRFYQDDEAKTKKALDALQKDYRELQASGGGSGTGPSGLKEADLREEVRATKSSLANLQLKYTTLKQQCENGIPRDDSSTSNTQKESEVQISQLQLQIRGLPAENKRLRSMSSNSTPSTGPKQVSTEDLWSSCMKICKELQYVAYQLAALTTVGDFPNEDDPDSDEGNQFQAVAEKWWSSSSNKKSIAWELLCSSLHEQILSVLLFGLQDRIRWLELELDLRTFEREPEKIAGIPGPKIQKWRCRTVEISSMFMYQANNSSDISLWEEVANEILHNIKNFTKSLDNEIQVRIQQSMIDAYAEAVNLKLSLRRLPEKIDIETLDKVVPSSIDHEIMLEGNKLPTEQTEVLTLMGPLVRYPLMGGRVVLQKPIIALFVASEGDEVPEEPTNEAPPRKKKVPDKPNDVVPPIKKVDVFANSPAGDAPSSEEL